jgi:hypothetical protein
MFDPGIDFRPFPPAQILENLVPLRHSASGDYLIGVSSHLLLNVLIGRLNAPLRIFDTVC